MSDLNIAKYAIFILTLFAISYLTTAKTPTDLKNIYITLDIIILFTIIAIALLYKSTFDSLKGNSQISENHISSGLSNLNKIILFCIIFLTIIVAVVLVGPINIWFK